MSQKNKGKDIDEGIDDIPFESKNKFPTAGKRPYRTAGKYYIYIIFLYYIII